MIEFREYCCFSNRIGKTEIGTDRTQFRITVHFLAKAAFSIQNELLSPSEAATGGLRIQAGPNFRSCQKLGRSCASKFLLWS